MPAALDDTTGEVAFVYNQNEGDPWHRAGIPVDGAMTGDELFERCPPLDFVVDKRPVLYADDNADSAGVRSFKGWSVVVRLDTMAALGIVRNTYRTFQNRDLTAFADAVIGESGAHYDTAGSIYEGKVVFVQLVLGEDFRVGDDPSEWQRRLLVWAGHDGRHALVAKRTHIRVVCANTHSSAMLGPGASFSIRHTSNMDVAVEDARKALGLVAAYDQSFEQAMAHLATLQVDEAVLTAALEDIFPVNPDVENPYRTEAARNTVRALFENSPTLVGVGKTKYRLFQAMTEYADHYKTYRSKQGSADDARAMSILDGAAQRMKEKALATLVKA